MNTPSKKHLARPVFISGAIIASGLSLLGLTACSGGTTPTPASPTTTSSATASTTPAAALAEDLAFLIEEEKLAFDVYTALNEKWGSQTFANILQSESTHQNQVLTVMQAYGVADPRSSEPGVFVNPELQKLYDELIAQGMQSELDAFKVGVLIEETDIADLTEMLKTNPPADVTTMMKSLLAGSENHLAAFSKKL